MNPLSCKMRFYYYGVKWILTPQISTLRHSSKILKRSILRRNQSEEGGGAWRTWRIARKFVKWIYPLRYISYLMEFLTLNFADQSNNLFDKKQ